MRIIILATLFALLSPPSQAAPKWVKTVEKVAEHLSLGAGTELGVTAIAGGGKKFAAGLTAAAVVAVVKEASDYTAHRDTGKQAIVHALTIIGGAGIGAAAWHSSPQPAEHHACDELIKCLPEKH